MTGSRKEILKRVYLTYLIILLIGIAIVGKVIYIQVAEGHRLMKKAAQRELRYFSIEANRGNILSMDGSLMATSVPIFEIRMDVSSPHISNYFFESNLDSLAYELSRLFKDRSKYEYRSLLMRARKKGNRYLRVKRKVTYEELKKLRKFPIFRRGKYKGGLIIRSKTKREMPYGNLAKRTIGYEIKRENLFVGIEGAYSEFLKGTEGRQLHRKLSHGDWKPVHNENQIEPENGKDLVTTIDINIQDVAEHALYKNLVKHNATQGCAIVMETATGYVKAIANLSYNQETSDYEEVYNYAIAEKVEPGSTFKLVSMIALLEDGKVGLNDSIDTGDGWAMFYNRTMKDVKKVRDGKISAREAFEKSSNVGISKLMHGSYKEDPDGFIKHIQALRLDEPLGIEVLGEAIPFIKTPDNRDSWYGTTLPWMSIGYEILLTPLQLLTLYNAVANGGKMVKPLFVKEIQQSGKTIKTYKPSIRVKKICSATTLDSIQSLLKGVVERGTGKSLNNAPYRIAGKTGTAQVADANRGYDQKIYNASFVGYFPADAPEYSCIVVINNPKEGYYYGSSVAIPVFREISDNIYATTYRLARKMEEPEKHTLPG
ncbi:MAG: penicillin-binding protein 2, partial [Bacteroidales bacterium]